MKKPAGHIRPHGGGYQIIVPVGRDPITKRYSYEYKQADSFEEAEAERDKMVARLTSKRKPRKEATFGELLDEVVEVTHLEIMTMSGYEGYTRRIIRPVLGDVLLSDLVDRPERIDKLYSALQRCIRLCGGRRGLIDHRPAGRSKLLEDGTPDHQCDHRCRPHQCHPASASTIGQVHAIIKRTLAYGVRWKWIDENPAALASRPEIDTEHDDPPTPEEAVKLLAAAEEHSRVMGVFVWLALVTGARRGELCALRWPSVNEEEEDIAIAGSYAVAKGQRRIKPPKTRHRRRLALDAGTLELLQDYKEHCRKEAMAAGGQFNEDGFVFSSDGFGNVPWNPDTISDWFRKIAKAAGVSTTLHGLRHYNATQMLSSGVDIRTAAARLGHRDGGTTTLNRYAHRTKPTDQRAAELLARQLRERGGRGKGRQ